MFSGVLQCNTGLNWVQGCDIRVYKNFCFSFSDVSVNHVIMVCRVTTQYIIY